MQPELTAIDKMCQIVNNLDPDKTIVFIIILVIIFLPNVIKLYLLRKDRDNLNLICESLGKVSESLALHETTSSERIGRLVPVLEEIRDRQKGIIGKTDSIRIIESKFSIMQTEITKLFHWSIINNGYIERKEFVRKRMKTEMAKAINLVIRDLNDFKLCVDTTILFGTYENESTGDIHLKLVDKLWDGVEYLYKKKCDVDKVMEEIEVIVQNIIQSDLERSKRQIQELY